MTKRIVIITNSYPDAASPELPFILPEVQALRSYGHEVALAPLRAPETLDPRLPAGTSVLASLAACYRPRKGLRTAGSAIRMAWVWREGIRSLRYGFRGLARWSVATIRAGAVRSLKEELGSYDIVYTYWFTGETTGATQIKGVRAVTRAHGFDLYEERPENRGYIPFRKVALERLDAVVLLSQQARNYLVEKYPNASLDSYVCSLGVESQVSLNRPPEPGVVRLASCSYPSQNKRLELIREISVQLALMMPEHHVEWVHFGCRYEDAGLGPGEPLPPNLAINFAGRMPNEAVREYYGRNPVTFFVNMSYDEGQPVSIMEAMSFGIPVIAPAVGGIPEMLSRGGGILVDRDVRPADVADMARMVLDDDQRYLAMRQEAVEAQRELFDTRRNHRALAAMLDRI